jgi:hypothetical protein
MALGRLALGTVSLVLAGTLTRPDAGSWVLPRGTAVKDAGPRTYDFVVDYTASDTRGRVTHRQRVEGEYTRGLPGGDAEWRNVTVAEVDGATAPLPPPQKRAFMEGLRYHKGPATLDETMKPDFFKGAPPTAVVERNLVWDEEAIEMFGQTQFEHLALNLPYRLLSSQNVDMPGIGTFQNRDVQLVWTGRSTRNGQECAVIQYRAFFNPLEIANGGMTLNGRSHYWGEIWVALATKQIEYATLYENVLGEMTLAGQSTPQILDVFRSGALQPRARR